MYERADGRWSRVEGKKQGKKEEGEEETIITLHSTKEAMTRLHIDTTKSTQQISDFASCRTERRRGAAGGPAPKRGLHQGLGGRREVPAVSRAT